MTDGCGTPTGPTSRYSSVHFSVAGGPRPRVQSDSVSDSNYVESPFAPIDETQHADLMPTVEPTARWVRVRFAGQVIADSRHALLLTQYGRDQLPNYYFPQSDVRMESLVVSTGADPDDEVGWRSVQVGDEVAANAAWIVLRPPSALAPLSGYISFAWGKMDGWYEEEEEVFVHARDPHKRVDVLPSSRHVRVAIDGAVDRSQGWAGGGAMASLPSKLSTGVRTAASTRRHATAGVTLVLTTVAFDRL